MKLQWFIVLAVLLLVGCEDSKNPLSDPTTSKPDERLLGVWRVGVSQGADVYYHIGHAGKEFPKGVLRVVEVTHSEGDVDTVEYFAFPTVLGGKTYLNVVDDEKQVKLMEEKGWKAGVVKSYTFVKYQLDGDTLLVWGIDEAAKEQAIKSGKIKGLTPWNGVASFTDTTENVGRFIANANDSLWDTKERFWFSGRLERVITHPRRTGAAASVPTPPLRPLGTNLVVDKNGFIWNPYPQVLPEWFPDRLLNIDISGGKPVGIWGIDGNVPHPPVPLPRTVVPKGQPVPAPKPMPPP